MLDLLILSKNEDGSVDALEIDDTPEVDAIRALEADVAEILAADDVELLSEAMEPGSFAGVLVFENRWAAPFAAATRRAGGQLIASGRIPIQAIAASIEAELASEEKGTDMPLRPARAMRRGVIGAPVARTAATVGTAAVVVHGVRRRGEGDRREDRREDRRDDRR